MYGGEHLKTNNKIRLNEKEAKLIELIRATNFGELRIIVQENVPIRVEEIKKSIKL